MLRRALRQGIEAVLADAWLGTKTMIGTALDLNLTAILRMKKNTRTYRLTTWENGEAQWIPVRLLFVRGINQNADSRAGAAQRAGFRQAPVGFFRALIAEAVDGLQETLGQAGALVMSAIDERVQRFFVQALQLDELTLKLEGAETRFIED